MTTPTFQELLTSQEVRFTNEQLEAWAGMKAFSILYTTDEGRTLALKTSQLAAALLAERKAREVEVRELRATMQEARLIAVDAQLRASYQRTALESISAKLRASLEKTSHG